jgi:hypothetical protein
MKTTLNKPLFQNNNIHVGLGEYPQPEECSWNIFTTYQKFTKYPSRPVNLFPKKKKKKKMTINFQ